MKGSDAKPLFNTVVLIMGYPLTIGTNFTYSYVFTESGIKTTTDFGVSHNINATLSINSFGELNIAYFANIKAGISGIAFKGSATGGISFRMN